jgi:hypothetical protein
MASRTAVCRGKRPGLSMIFADYAAAVGINFSTLKHMARSPLHYMHALQNPPAVTPAMLLGRAVHGSVLEPRRFQLDYAVWSGDRRGAAYQEFADEAATQGRSILRENEYNIALAISDSVRSIPEVAALLGKGFPEVSIFWTDPSTGLSCKGRPDWISGDGAILDLKTTCSIDPRIFAAHAWRMGYFHQAAMYQEGFAVTNCPGGIPRFGIIAVEKDPPYACRLFWLDPDSLSKAWSEYQSWLRQVRDCQASGIWPGPGPVESELIAPAWATADNEAVNFDGVEE